MRQIIGKKIISVFLIIIFIFNFTGCATTGNKVDKTGQKLATSLENNKIVDNAKDLKVNNNDRMIAGILGGIFCGGLLPGGIILIPGFQAAKNEKDRLYTLGIGTLAIISGTIGGYKLGENVYDNWIDYSNLRKNKRDRMITGILGSAICGLLIGGGIALYGFTREEAKKTEEVRLIFSALTAVGGLVGIIGGFYLGEYVYDNWL